METDNYHCILSTIAFLRNFNAGKNYSNFKKKYFLQFKDLQLIQTFKVNILYIKPNRKNT